MKYLLILLLALPVVAQVKNASEIQPEQEFHGWMIIGMIAAPIFVISWLSNERQIRKEREAHNRIHNPRVYYRAYFKKITREQAADELEAEDAYMKGLAKKHGIQL